MADARADCERHTTFFLESLEIGYSYPMVRPPNDMYVSFLEPFHTSTAPILPGNMRSFS